MGLAAWGQDPEQVTVSVRIVEYQMVKSIETGLSAFFARRNTPRAYGRVMSGNGAITTADLTFPISTQNAGLTVFLDQIRMSEGDLEMVLQGLVDQSQAYILAKPQATLKVGGGATKLETVKELPYEDPKVVGAVVVRQTSFRNAGVMMEVTAKEIADDDGDPNTTDDTYILLDVTADLKEPGADVVVAADDQLYGADAISAPRFLTRTVHTQVWVRHGQVLILGGLFRNQKDRKLRTLPWISQGETVVMGLMDRLVPGDLISSPISSTLGSRAVGYDRVELVFFIKCERWRPAYTVADDHGFFDLEEDEEEGKSGPKDVIKGVVEGIADLPQGIAEGISGTSSEDSIESELGGIEE